jgi:hypothetical protein
MESDASEAQAALALMTAVATQLKAALAKAGKGAAKAMTLDRAEQRAYDGLA